MSFPIGFTITIVGSSAFTWNVFDDHNATMTNGTATSVPAAAGLALNGVITQLQAQATALTALATNWNT